MILSKIKLQIYLKSEFESHNPIQGDPKNPIPGSCKFYQLLLFSDPLPQNVTYTKSYIINFWFYDKNVS